MVALSRCSASRLSEERRRRPPAGAPTTIRSAASSAAIWPSSAAGSPTAERRSARSESPCSEASRATRRAASSCLRVRVPFSPVPWTPSATCAKTNRSFSRSLRSAAACRAARPWSVSLTQHRIVPCIVLPARGLGHRVASSASDRHRVSTGSPPRLGRDLPEPLARYPRRNAAEAPWPGSSVRGNLL